MVDKNVAFEIALDYAATSKIKRYGTETLYISRALHKTISLPEMDDACQTLGRQITFTMGDARLNADGSMWLHIDICAAHCELINEIPDWLREEGLKSWLDTYANRTDLCKSHYFDLGDNSCLELMEEVNYQASVKPEKLRKLPPSLACFLPQQADDREELHKLIKNFCDQFICDLSDSDRKQCRGYLRMLDRLLVHGMSPYLLTPDAIIRVLRLYLRALENTWGHLDVSKARLTAVDIYYQFHVSKLQNLMPGLIQRATRDTGFTESDDTWAKILTRAGKGMRLARGLYMLGENGEPYGEILRLVFRLAGKSAHNSGIIDFTKLFTESAYSEALHLEPLVSELQKRISKIKLYPCLNEVDLVRDGDVHSLRSLLLFLMPNLRDDYFASKHINTENPNEARRKEEERLRPVIRLVPIEQPYVPDVLLLTDAFHKAIDPNRIYCLTDLAVKEEILNVSHKQRKQTKRGRIR